MENYQAPPHVMTFDEKIKLFDAYVKANKRLLLLDYDGTLVPYFVRPNEAVPDSELKDLLRELNSQPENDVIIISGRDAVTLEIWFTGTGVSIVAEHGAMFKRVNSEWQNYIAETKSWGDETEQILEKFLRTYKGSFIEKKKHSIAFHYRAVKTDKANELRKQLLQELSELPSANSFSVLNGNMVIEIKSVEQNKGKFVKRLLETTDYDFVLAVGDDATDEDMFIALENFDNAFTVKVGIVNTRAKCNFINVGNVISFLEQLNKYKSVNKQITRNSF